jgi:hypothetical protein
MKKLYTLDSGAIMRRSTTKLVIGAPQHYHLEIIVVTGWNKNLA